MDKTVAEVFGQSIVKPNKTKNNPDKMTNPDLMVGLELEIENLPNGHEWYRDHAGGFWAVVEDGSLRPRGESWEFVSRPAAIGVAAAELRLLVEKFKLTEENYTDRCSVHVHTNVQDFTKAQVANITLVYPVVEEVLFQFVNHYKSKEKQGYCRDTNLYCIPWSSCRLNRNFIEGFFDNPAQYSEIYRRTTGARRWEKYTALNLLPIADKGTVEWRHMHGTADLDKLGKWLNLIGSIMLYCKTHHFDDIVKTIKVMNDVSTYQHFFTEVLGTTLSYKEEYRRSMAEGVVNAKYSLINLEANKGKEKPASKKFLSAGVEPADHLIFDDDRDEALTWEEMRARTARTMDMQLEQVRQQVAQQIQPAPRPAVFQDVDLDGQPVIQRGLPPLEAFNAQGWRAGEVVRVVQGAIPGNPIATRAERDRLVREGRDAARARPDDRAWMNIPANPLRRR